MSNQWAIEKQKEMYELWQTHFPDHKSGFELFTSPMYENASAVIIGYNAGGGDREATTHNRYMDRFLADEPDFSLPDHGHYPKGEAGYLVASRIRKYLFNGKEHLLENAVETNRYFLRTEDKSHHHDIMEAASESTRESYLNFCRDTIRGVIQRANPSVVVDFGGEKSAKKFSSDLNYGFEQHDTHKLNGENGTTISIEVGELTDSSNTPFISISPHLSYPPLAMEHLNFLKETVPPLLPE